MMANGHIREVGNSYEKIKTFKYLGCLVTNENWVDWAQDRDLLESPCECGIEPPGSIRHGVSRQYGAAPLQDKVNPEFSVLTPLHLTPKLGGDAFNDKSFTLSKFATLR